jgi:hypothetical protein
MKNRIVGWLATACVLTVVAVLAVAAMPTIAISADPNRCAPEPNSAGGYVWGEPVNGLKAAVEFIPEMKSYAIGRQVSIRFHIQNVSDHVIEFTTSTWRLDKTQCMVEDATGKMMPSFPVWYTGMAIIERKRLSPGQTTTIESASLGFVKEGQMESGFNDLVSPLVRVKPGKYLLWYQLDFPDAMFERKGRPLYVEPDDWKGTLKTGKRVINVVVTDPNYPSAAEIAKSKGISLDARGAFTDKIKQHQRARQECFDAVMTLTTTLRHGKTRQELEEYFIKDGGKQTLLDERYYYAGCPYVKIKVDFQPADPNYPLESKSDRITSISLPYFEEPL